MYNTKKIQQMGNLELLVSKVDQAKIEAEKFFKGNNAAGTRYRKLLLDITAIAKEARKEISEVKESRKS